MMNLRKFNYIFLLFSTVFIFSCQQEAEQTPTPTNPNSGINRFVWNYMRERYLWNDKMPQNINPDRFTTPQLLLDAIIFKESDRFTSIVKDDGARLNQITTGSAAGYGVLIGQDAQRNWRFLSVFPNSPASEAGLTRGMRIISVDGKATTTTERPTLNTSASSSIEVEDTEGKIRVITATPRTYTQQPVIHTEIRTVGARKIGYIVYQSFTQVSEEALTRTFAQFRSEGVSELIVDLRYNGGGLVRTLQILGSMIAPANAIGRPLLKNQNNERNSRENSDILFENNPNRLNLNRVAFIATGSSASASEILINSLRPFMNVAIVGSRTFGKFVGGPIMVEQNHTFAPITFRTTNAIGEVFYQGMEPNFATAEDASRNWGDTRDPMFGAALHYAINGNFNGFSASTSGRIEVGKEITNIYGTEPVLEGLYWRN
ncbi:MAG: hypothetical protein OHK0057_15490 [Thermoflexibacter sp.]